MVPMTLCWMEREWERERDACCSWIGMSAWGRWGLTSVCQIHSWGSRRRPSLYVWVWLGYWNEGLEVILNPKHWLVERGWLDEWAVMPSSLHWARFIAWFLHWSLQEEREVLRIWLMTSLSLGIPLPGWLCSRRLGSAKSIFPSITSRLLNL